MANASKPEKTPANQPRRRKPGRPRDRELVQRRRDEIIYAAIRAFAKVGYPSTDLEQVAADLGCAKGTLYRYFPSKRELFEAAVDRVMQEMMEAVDPVEIIPDPADRLGAFLKTSLAFFDEHPDYVEMLIQERAEFRDREKPTFFTYNSDQMESRRDMLRGLMKQGRFREMPPDQILDVVGTVLYGTIFTSYFARRTKSYEQQANEIVEILLLGILSPEEAEAYRRRHA